MTQTIPEGKCSFNEMDVKINLYQGDVWIIFLITCRTYFFSKANISCIIVVFDQTRVWAAVAKELAQGPHTHLWNPYTYT